MLQEKFVILREELLVTKTHYALPKQVLGIAQSQVLKDIVIGMMMGVQF